MCFLYRHMCLSRGNICHDPTVLIQRTVLMCLLMRFMNNNKKEQPVLVKGNDCIPECMFRAVLVSAVDSITDVYTVSQLKQKSWENPEIFFGITYSFISKLDLDSSVSKVIRTRWWVQLHRVNVELFPLLILWCFTSTICLSSRCKFMASEDGLSCTNEFCPGRDQIFSATAGYDLLVDLTDHTGTLQCCTLRSPVAEKMLGCTVNTATQEHDNSATG